MLDVAGFPTKRIVLARFFRAVQGDPVQDAPDVDERGYAAPYHGPMVAVAAGRTVRVAFARINLDAATPLFVQSSDTSALTVADPASGRVPATARAEISITGVDGGTGHRDAQVQLRIGTPTGPVIHTLHVLVLKPLVVRMTPHRVTISSTKTAGTAPVADIAAIMAKVADIWVHAGITITVLPIQTSTVVLATADVMNDVPLPAEVARMVANRWPDGTPNWVPATINAYFVNQIGTRHTLGYGFSPQSFTGFGLPHPGIILGDRTASSVRSGLIHYANDLAHEVGHFFTLWHAGGKEPPNEREDTWARRMLMHNFNGTRGHTPWPVNTDTGKPFKERPRFNDVGYGVGRRGCMITNRDLAQFSGDGECLTARAAILSAAGPY